MSQHVDLNGSPNKKNNSHIDMDYPSGCDFADPDDRPHWLLYELTYHRYLLQPAIQYAKKM